MQYKIYYFIIHYKPMRYTIIPILILRKQLKQMKSCIYKNKKELQNRGTTTGNHVIPDCIWTNSLYNFP